MTNIQPSLGIVLLFLLFSLIFFINSYRLWFKTDEYYQELFNSLTREPSMVPFRNFFLKRMENKKRWVLWQKVFSAIAILAVLAADILMIQAYLQ